MFDVLFKGDLLKMKRKYGKIIEVVEMAADILDDLRFDEDKYEDVWDNGEDDGIDYSDLAGYEYEDESIGDYVDPEEDADISARWDAIDRLRGKVKKGKCIFCGKRNGMHLTPMGNYACQYCHDTVPDEVYLQWYAGFDVYFTEK